MPDNTATRPRYVNPPQDFTTPPFVPSQDPYAGLEQVLNNLQLGVQPQPQSRLQQVLSMIANAAAVGTSNDPGAALGHLLQNQQQQRLLQQQQQQQQLDQLNNLKVQIAFKKADQLAQEQRDLRQEQKTLALKREERQFDIDKWREEQQNRLNELDIQRGWKLEDQKKAFKQDLELRRQYGDEINELERKANDARNFDKRTVNQIELATKYRLSGLTADKADALAKAQLEGTSLTTSQQKDLDQASSFDRKMVLEKHRAEIAHLYRMGRGSGGGGTPKDIFLDTAKRNLANTIFDSQYVETLDKGIVNIKDATKDIFGQPDASKVKRYLTQEENYQRSAQIAGQIGSKLGITNPEQPVPTTGTDEAGFRNWLMDNIKKFQAAGESAALINTRLDAVKKEQPAYANIVDTYKLKPEVTFPGMPSISPNDEYSDFKEMRKVEPNLTIEQFRKRRQATRPREGFGITPTPEMMQQLNAPSTLKPGTKVKFK